MTRLRERFVLKFQPNSITAAEIRWRRHNEESRARGCPCGRPAEKVKRFTDVVGMVPYEWWTCAEHEGISSFSNGKAYWRHDATCPLGEDRSWGGPIGGPTEYWDCPHRNHEVSA